LVRGDVLRQGLALRDHGVEPGQLQRCPGRCVDAWSE
jgi:hypothetical protein